MGAGYHYCKGICLVNRRNWLEEELLPETINPYITADNAPEFIRYLQSTQNSNDINLIANRLNWLWKR